MAGACLPWRLADPGAFVHNVGHLDPLARAGTTRTERGTSGQWTGWDDDRVRYMKDLKRMLVYGGGALLAILLLTKLAASHEFSGNTMVILAILLVIVLPAFLVIRVAKREHRAHERGK